MMIYNINNLMSPPGYDNGDDDDGNTSSSRSGWLATDRPSGSLLNDIGPNGRANSNLS